MAHHCDDPDLALLKVGKNAFNDCNIASFLAMVSDSFLRFQLGYVGVILSFALAINEIHLTPCFSSLVVLDFVCSI